MSATKGTVALKTDQILLTCSTGCAAQAGVRDFVGYGSGTSSFEGSSPAPTLSNTTAARRAANGATDADNNASDFSSGAPTQRNSAYTGGGTCTGSRIHDVQGAAHISAKNGQPVTGVPGVVTARSGTGFWFQDPNPDTSPATSEGLFVYTSTPPSVQVGDSVRVSGTVSEFLPGGTSGASNLTITELTGPSVSVVSSGNPLPTPAVIGPGGRVPPATVIDNLSSGDVETRTTFDPATQGIDFWESMEGMRVELDNAAVVGRRDASYGEIPVVPAAEYRNGRGYVQRGESGAQRPQAKFDGLAGQVRNNLQSPVLIAVEEIQDNSGATDNGVVAADQTWSKLINAITAAGGPAYQYGQIDPPDDQDGGAPGGTSARASCSARTAG